MFEFVFFANNIIEPELNKTKKITCAPSEDSDQLGHPPSLISLRSSPEKGLGPKLLIKCTAKTLSNQADLNLLGAQVILLVLLCSL